MRCALPILAVLVLCEPSAVAQIDPPTADEPPAEAPADEPPAEAPADEPPAEVPAESIPEATVETPHVEAPPVETPAANDAAASSVRQMSDSPPSPAVPAHSSAAHLCKVESQEAMKILSSSGTTGANVWGYGSWVYSSLGEREVENGIAECKLLCDADEECHRWIYSCETKTCRYIGHGGLEVEDKTEYSFIGEAADIKAKVEKELEKAKAQAAAKAAAEEVQRLQALADAQAELNAAAKAQKDVTGAQNKLAEVIKEKNDRRLAASKTASAPLPSQDAPLGGTPEGEL